MCLILFAHLAHPRYRLVVAANRDEWFRRPSAAAAFWSDHPELLAGRDLDQGGTWLGVTRYGRFAALTNFRDPASKVEAAPSRGALVTQYLAGADDPASYASALVARAGRYNGFNLVVGSGDSMAYVASRGGHATLIEPGVHGLSNGVLDEPWPKVRKGRDRLSDALGGEFGTEDLFDILRDDALAPDEELPSTGVSRDWERRLSAMHIVAGEYGTRCATVVLFGTDATVSFEERTFDPSGRVIGVAAHAFELATR